MVCHISSLLRGRKRLLFIVSSSLITHLNKKGYFLVQKLSLSLMFDMSCNLCNAFVYTFYIFFINIKSVYNGGKKINLISISHFWCGLTQYQVKYVLISVCWHHDSTFCIIPWELNIWIHSLKHDWSCVYHYIHIITFIYLILSAMEGDETRL